MFDQLFTYKYVFVPFGDKKLVYIEATLNMDIPASSSTGLTAKAGDKFNFAILDVY